MYTDQTPNARYGRITMRVWTAANAVLLVAASAGFWFFAARANRRGIQPNTSLGFRSQHTMASLQGWYVAQRVGFHFAAVSTTVVSLAVLVFVVVAYARRLNPMWIMIVPAIGGLAVGACLILAGQRADHAAAAVEKPAAMSQSLICPGHWSAQVPPKSIVESLPPRD
jgi:hypothetical protein